MTDFKAAAIRICAMAGVVCGLLTATPARSQECQTLRETAAIKLEEYLQKELEYRITKKSMDLIEKWRSDHEDAALLEDEWDAAKASIDGLQLEAEQAENDYDNARFAVSDGCADGG